MPSIKPTSDHNPPPLKYSEASVKTVLPADKKKPFYHVNKVIKIYCLYIPSFVATKIITLVHNTGYPRFSQCFEIITHFWYI